MITVWINFSSDDQISNAFDCANSACPQYLFFGGHFQAVFAGESKTNHAMYREAGTAAHAHGTCGGLCMPACWTTTSAQHYSSSRLHPMRRDVSTSTP